MIWTVLAVLAATEVFFGLYLWRRYAARADAVAATDPEQATEIRRAALRLAAVFLLSPFLIAIAGWLAVGPPDFTW
jgi:hypothetical protein